MRHTFIVLSILVACQAMREGTSGPEHPVTHFPDDIALEEKPVEERALCRDVIKECAILKRVLKGICTNKQCGYFRFMTTNCKASCGFCEKPKPTTPVSVGCTGEEQDKKRSCAYWKSKGYCESGNRYYNYMRKNCEASCKNCGKPKPTTSVSVGGLKEDCLQAHNSRRACHGASKLVWDKTLAQHAQKWANYLLKLGKLKHASGTGEGENLYWSSKSTVSTCEDAMKGWYDDEEPKYDYNNTGFSSATGHFTQVVWKGTTKLGVAVAYKREADKNRFKTFVVARYYPPGNYQNQFKQNVGPKIKRCQ